MTLSVGELACAIAAILLIKRMEMERNKVNRCADPACLELINDAVAADFQNFFVNLKDIEMPGVLNIGSSYRRGKGVERRKIPCVTLRQCRAPGEQSFTLLELSDTDRGLQVR